MNDIVDTNLLFDYEYMREKIREKLGVRNINEFHDITFQAKLDTPIGITMRALNKYGIRPYFGFVVYEKIRLSSNTTPLMFYTDTNVKVQLSNNCFNNGATDVSISFTSDDGTISCSGYLQLGDTRLSCDLTALKHATPYIDPAIYLDYLLCCPTSEVVNVFTKHEPLLARLMEENTKLWDEVVELKEENIRLSKYNKTLEMKNANLTDENGHLSKYTQELEITNTYLTEENNGWIESERISNSEIRYMKEQIEEIQETANEKQAELGRIRYTCLAVILYFAAFGILAFLNMIWHKR